MARKTRNERKGAKSSSAPATSTLLSTYRPFIDQALFALAIIGVIVTVHLMIQQSRGFDQGCWGFNPPSAEEAATFNCEAVVTSDAGKLFGISNVYWGMIFYGLLSVFGFLVARAKGADVSKFKKLRAGMIGLGFLYSGYLVYIQATSIGEYCALCLTSAAIMAIMFAIMLYDVFTSSSVAGKEGPARSMQLYKILAGVAVVLIGADLLYFNNLEVEAPPAATAATATAAATGAAGADPADVCQIDTRMPKMDDYRSILSSFDPVVGPEDAAVTVVEFFDPNCPSCQRTHPVMKEVITKYQDRVRFHMIPFPLRESSLPQIEALYVAKEQEKFFEMLDAQMAMQETRGLPVEQVRELAGILGLDVALLNNRWRSQLYRRVILEQREKISATGMSSVPSVLVNGEYVLQKTTECISQFIDSAAS
ncbi:MAG: vitamin K epoxide reductase family protein [Bacteroidota bacterium]